MGLKFTETHTVSYYECDLTQTMTVPMLISVVVKTSESQSYRVNKDYPTIVEDRGLGWVITHYDIHINRLPKQNERIFVTTEADDYNKFFCYRNFWVHDEEGNELVKINSIFVLMNLETRHIVSVPKDIVSVYQSQKTTKVRRFDKIPTVTEPESEQYRVRYFDLDGNGHVNNAKYLNWILDSLSYDFLIAHRPKRILIRFDKEVEYGNIITSQWEEHFDNEDDLYSLHRIMLEDTLSAEAKIEWEPIIHVSED